MSDMSMETSTAIAFWLYQGIYWSRAPSTPVVGRTTTRPRTAEDTAEQEAAASYGGQAVATEDTAERGQAVATEDTAEQEATEDTAGRGQAVATEDTAEQEATEDTSERGQAVATIFTPSSPIVLSTLKGRSEYNRNYYQKRKLAGTWYKTEDETRRPYNRTSFPKRDPGYEPMGQESIEERHARIAKQRAMRLQGLPWDHAKATGTRNERAMEFRRLNPDAAAKFDADNTSRARTYQKNKYHSDARYKAMCVVRSRLSTCLKLHGYKKTAHTEELVGCSWDYLVAHLHNSGTGLRLTEPDVHVDHIRPLASFSDLSNAFEQRTANHHLNLQLLSAHDNLIKGAHFDYNEWRVSDSGQQLLALNRRWRMQQYFGTE
jgi:hypothetical protein